MHLTRAILGLLLGLTAALPGFAQGNQAGQQAPAAQAPAAQAPTTQAPAVQTPGRPTSPAQATPAPATRRTAPPATIGLPNPTPIAEIPRGRTVLLAGLLLSPQPRTFVLNDGNSAIVINLGPTWQELSGLKAGDRVRVLGQIDPYGASVFRAGSVVLDNGRIIVVPN